MPNSDLKRLLLSKCAKVPESDSVLMSAIIEVESAWDPKRMKFEPTFMYIARPQEFALKNGIDLITEKALQRFSFGLGQLMGGTCRGFGYGGPLVNLLEPDINIDYMLIYFQKICSQFVYPTDKIAAYNAGSVTRLANGTYINQTYVDKVLGVLTLDPSWKAAQTALPSSDKLN